MRARGRGPSRFRRRGFGRVGLWAARGGVAATGSPRRVRDSGDAPVQSRRKMSGRADPSGGVTAPGEPAKMRNTSANGRPGVAGPGRTAGRDALGACGGAEGGVKLGVVGPKAAPSAVAGCDAPRPDAAIPGAGASTGAGRGRASRGRGACGVRSAARGGRGAGTGAGAGRGNSGRAGAFWTAGAGRERIGSLDGVASGTGAGSVRSDRGDSGGACGVADASRGVWSGASTADAAGTDAGAVAVSPARADESPAGRGGGWRGAGPKLR